MTTSTELARPDQFRALQPDARTLDLVRENLDGGEISEFDFARVRMPSGGGSSWEVPVLGGTDPRKTIEGICIMSKFTRSFWEEDEPSGDGSPPDCSSPDATLAQPREGVSIPAVPDPATGLLQCETCAYGQWGSAEKGSGKGQRCKKYRALFMLTPERMLPVVVVLSPASLKPAQQFFLSLVDFGVDQHEVVVEIGLEKVSGSGVPDFARATFKAGDHLSAEQAQMVKDYAAVLRPMMQAARVDPVVEGEGEPKPAETED